MDFAFTEEQLLAQKTFRQFALEKVLPNAARRDRGESITKEVIKAVDSLGVRMGRTTHALLCSGLEQSGNARLRTRRGLRELYRDCHGER